MAGWRADDDGPRLLPPLGRGGREYRKPSQRISYTIQTNGTRLDDDWAVFFKENNFLVGLSVDGTKPLHD
ncbi:MAG: hypothetical protein WBN35_00380, partial [Acidimicrobiia bacterium]